MWKLKIGLPWKIKIPLYSIIIAIILMIIIGTIGTLEPFGAGTRNFTFFFEIVISIFLFIGIFEGIHLVLLEVFLVKKESRGLKAKLLNGFKKFVTVLFTLIISLVSLLGVMLTYYAIRLPPSFNVDPELQLENWTIIPSGSDLTKHHKSNTELFYWNSEFYLVYQSSKWHLQDINGELVVAKSPDATAGSWETVATIKGPGQNDVRDPLLTDINGTLFLYFLPNFQFDPSPNWTFYSSSIDGENWSEPEQIFVNVSHGITWQLEGGWHFGRQEPITNDNITWYTMASNEDEDNPATLLLGTNDGINWKEVSIVYDTFFSDEACMTFLPNGEIIATLRVSSVSTWEGYLFGTPHACTIIATSYNNHLNWSHAADFQTRLDGATIFTLDNGKRVFAAGRNHLGPSIDLGNHVSKKRTSIYEVKQDRLIHLFDLPSNGDTAYTGVVLKDDDIYISYYTCPINHDYPWIVGIMLLTNTEIRMAKFSATGLLQYADQIGGG
ncbi:MAG: sialidase family protein [Candidatus Thorarchaeota archaeon]